MSLHYRQHLSRSSDMQKRLETDIIAQLTNMKDALEHELVSDDNISKNLQFRISKALASDTKIFGTFTDFKPSMLAENFEHLVTLLERQYNVDRLDVYRMHQFDERRRHALCYTVPEPPCTAYHPDFDVHSLVRTPFSSFESRYTIARMNNTRSLVDELTSMNNDGLLSRCYEIRAEIYELNVLIAGMRRRA